MYIDLQLLFNVLTGAVGNCGCGNKTCSCIVPRLPPWYAMLSPGGSTKPNAQIMCIFPF